MQHTLGRLLGFLYGLAAYLVFFVTILYAIGFVTGLFVPKTIDTGTVVPLAEALIVNLLLLSLFAAEVLLLMTAPAFHTAVSFIPMAALAMVVLATKYHFAYGILREKKTQFHMYINTSTAVLQILLNFFLIRWIGLWGAVLAGLLAYATKSVCYLTISQRLYPVPFELGKFLSLLAGSAVLVAFADLTLGLTWTGFAVKCLLAVIATVLPLALGMLTKGDLARAITLVRGKLGFPDVR